MATMLAKARTAGVGALATTPRLQPPSSFRTSFLRKAAKPSPGFSWQGAGRCCVTGARAAGGEARAPAGVTEVMGSLMKSEGLRFGVVVARFNEIITRPLLAGALETFRRYQVREEDVDVVWVPGSFEIPVVAQQLALSEKYHAILCIGAVVRGATTHYDAVANSAASGIMSASLKSNTPCIFGVLTTENMEQAIDRAGGKAGNKGAEAALTAIEMASLFQHHHLDSLTKYRESGEEEGFNTQI